MRMHFCFVFFGCAGSWVFGQFNPPFDAVVVQCCFWVRHSIANDNGIGKVQTIQIWNVATLGPLCVCHIPGFMAILCFYNAGSMTLGPLLLVL